MVAELAMEVPLHPEQGRGHLVIPEDQRQETKVYHEKARVGLGSYVRFSVEIPQEYKSSAIPDLLFNGCTGTEELYAPFRGANTQLGKTTVSMDTARGNAISDLCSPGDMLHAEVYQMRSAEAVLDALEARYGITTVRAKTHSMGTRAGVALAERQPERFRGITAISSAGTDEYTLAQMAGKRLPEFFTGEFIPNLDRLYDEFGSTKVLADFLWHNFGSNALRTAVETLSIGSAKGVTARLEALEEAGMLISLVNGEADKLTPNKILQRKLGKGTLAHSYMLSNPRAGHIAMQTDPVRTSIDIHSIDQEIDSEVNSPRDFETVEVMRGVKTQRQQAPQLSSVA